MNIKRIVPFVLALCMLASVSCSKDQEHVTNDSTDTDISDTAESGSSHGLPDNLRFDGRSFRVLATPGAYYGQDRSTFNIEDSPDVLNQAMYNRLFSVEDRFGITMELYYGVENEIDDVSRAAINSMSDEYDIVADVSDRHAAVVYEGLYMPVNELPYVDLEKPWWSKDYIESVSINPENPYILFGAINHNGLQRTVCTYFNMDMLEDRKGISEQDMYDIVLNGEWTFDKMAEIIKDVYVDENGSTTKDAGDKFGLVRWNNFSAEIMAYSSGLTFVGRDEDGYPVLALNNERSIALADKLLSMFTNSNPDVINISDNHEHVTFFGEGNAIFTINRFFIVEWDQLRNSEINYGIIPMPKLDENVESYTSAVHWTAQWQMVPITEPDPEFASAIIEYLAWYGYEKIIPAYYENNLKFKYTRGDLDGASRMLDLIVESQKTDFMAVNALGGMEKIFTEVVNSGSNTFASKYASMEMAANNKIKQYIDTLG